MALHWVLEALIARNYCVIIIGGFTSSLAILAKTKDAPQNPTGP
jgi:hypothetical protein